MTYQEFLEAYTERITKDKSISESVRKELKVLFENLAIATLPENISLQRIVDETGLIAEARSVLKASPRATYGDLTEAGLKLLDERLAQVYINFLEVLKSDTNISLRTPDTIENLLESARNTTQSHTTTEAKRSEYEALIVSNRGNGMLSRSLAFNLAPADAFLKQAAKRKELESAYKAEQKALEQEFNSIPANLINISSNDGNLLIMIKQKAKFERVDYLQKRQEVLSNLLLQINPETDVKPQKEKPSSSTKPIARRLSKLAPQQRENAVSVQENG